MKTIISKTKIFAVALATFFATTATNTVFAKDEPKQGMELSYIGNIDELPVYRLSLNNKMAGTYVVTIKDLYGNVLHTEKVSGTNVVRNYKFETEIPDGESLSFEVVDMNAKNETLYKVNKIQRLTNEVVINKIK